jgi:hypothetical protein
MRWSVQMDPASESMLRTKKCAQLHVSREQAGARFFQN